MNKADEKEFTKDFEGIDDETRHALAGWRNFQFDVFLKSATFTLPDIPKKGRWLRIRGRGKSRTWTPEKGKLYLVKSENATMNPRSIMRGTEDGDLALMWAMPPTRITHVWVK